MNFLQKVPLLWMIVFCGLIPGESIAQHIYVRSNSPDQGGWLVDSTASTIGTIPAGWRLAHNAGPMAMLTDWPVLLEHFPRRDSAAFAFMYEDGSWEVLHPFNRARALGQSCFRLGQKGNRNSTLLCSGRKIELDQIVIDRSFNQEGVAIARYYPVTNKHLHGLMDKSGAWVLPPNARSITSLGHSRYVVEDTLRQAYLLQIRKESSSVDIDTILNLTEKGWQLRREWPFDETGHTWVYLGPRQQLIIDTNGVVKSDTIFSYASLLKPFREGLSWAGRPGYLVDTAGEPVLPGKWFYKQAFAEGRALVQDTISSLFGYLDRNGNWAIPPAYCYATSFRDGLAITRGTSSEKCSDKVVEKGSTATSPPLLSRYASRKYFELLNLDGEVVLHDSCYELLLLPDQVIGRNEGVGTRAPAIRINWLKNGKYWISPDYHFSRWDQLKDAPTLDVRRIDLGISRYSVGMMYGERRFVLPVGFKEKLLQWTALHSLNLDFHYIEETWPEILQMQGLTHFYLRACKLTELPEDIDQLKNLVTLDLSDNELSELPKSLFRMRHLEELNVANNPLPPETIIRLRKRLPATKIVYKREW